MLRLKERQSSHFIYQMEEFYEETFIGFKGTRWNEILLFDRLCLEIYKSDTNVTRNPMTTPPHSRCK